MGLNVSIHAGLSPCDIFSENSSLTTGYVSHSTFDVDYMWKKTVLLLSEAASIDLPKKWATLNPQMN